jgi:hypothetical protein
MVWVGNSGSPLWRVAANWDNATVPGPSDDAVFDSSSAKNCLVDSPMTVGSLNVKPGYRGRLALHAIFTVNGNFTVRDTLSVNYNGHEFSRIRGAVVDLSALKKCIGTMSQFSLDLEAPAGTTQRLIPPSDTSVQLPSLRTYGYGTVSVEGDLNVIIFDASPGQTINWNGHGGRFGLFAHGARAEGLGGSEFVQWAYVSWSPDGFGRSKSNSGRVNTELSNLAPDMPWKYSVVWTGPLPGIWSDPAYYPPNPAISGARVGNCDATGGLQVCAVRSMDMGNNLNVTFDQSIPVTTPQKQPRTAVRQAVSAPTRTCDMLGRSHEAANAPRNSSRHLVLVNR